ncbi:DUF2071 domain-containing protein [Virgibacillus sp. 179-BFC.A HS]|uniref:DUF2071 domain-containing protein n=1 Tax=Tigheibacillus jepli TaxID=3035914 RepID=A0ABU5CL49_9BACI|nr:DUF2071 domain-containing protein [Virgibacillus sp. 179-BFC.A HS]MDY0407089.1 DUF2071 domain-containing protein [Virgibacillus sp. 179-BFC.A HS]
MHNAFSQTHQRPFPLPKRRWMMTQSWHHLLFCHWQADEKILRKLLPPELEVDTYEGKAWIGVLPFRVKNMRVRGMPNPPFINTFLQLNIRTYVTYNGVPGIFFFTLDSDKWLTVIGGKIGALVPYRKAAMRMYKRDDKIHFHSEPDGADSIGRKLDLEYHPVSEPYSPDPESLEYWLFERYCYFTVLNKKVYRGDTHHTHWKVSKAEANIHQYPLYKNLINLDFTEKPLLHYTRKKQAFMWTPVRA